MHCNLPRPGHGAPTGDIRKKKFTEYQLDRSLSSSNLDQVDQCHTKEQLANAGNDPNSLFKHVNTELCKDKILSMDVANEA